jgi:hypothetical protein
MYIFLAFYLALFGCQTSTFPELTISQFQDVHRKVYSVYQVPLKPDEIHDLLFDIFSGEALTTEYIEHYTARVHMETDDTAIVIKQIDYNQTEILESYPTYCMIDADWSVGGIVTHQKHKHPRVNRYRAVFMLEPNDVGDWKIVDTKMRNAERIQRAGIRDSDFFDGKTNTGGYLDPLDLIDAGVNDEEGD